MKKIIFTLLLIISMLPFAYAHILGDESVPFIKCDICPEDKPFQAAAKGQCSSDVNQCVSCDDPIAFGMADPNDCSACPNRKMDAYNLFCMLKECPSDRPLRQDSFGSCYSCDEASFVRATTEDCSKCPNRKSIDSQTNNACILSEAFERCPSDKPVYSGISGNTMSVTLIGPRRPFDIYMKIFENSMQCNDCNNGEALITTEEQCAKCPNRYLAKGNVERAKLIEISSIKGTVFDPDNKDGAWESVSSTLVRLKPGFVTRQEHFKDILKEDRGLLESTLELAYRKGECVLNTCPAEKPLSYGGECHPCDTKAWWKFENCHACSNRFISDEGGCLPCDSGGDNSPFLDKASRGECSRCSSRVNGTNNECFECENPHSLKVDAKTCQLCPNRKMDENGLCVLKECPKESPMRVKVFEDWGYSCTPCNLANTAKSSKAECDKCPNRVYQNGECILKNN